jgi:4-hydroxy 2-oxovalerate aldolase
MILAYSKETERDLLVDGTLYGMGKSAGNAPIELVAMHMNNEYGKSYHLSQYLEAIDANIMEFYQPATWGYSMFFFIAASNDCHPDYVKQLTNKHTLSIKQMNELLGRLEGEKKLLYDKNYMEKLYLEFQDMEINDEQSIEALAKELQGKTILVTGPGKTMETEGGKVGDFVMSRNPVIISINYASRVFMPNYIFLTNSKRYIQVATILSKEKIPIIATSNLTPTDKPFEHVVNISDLLDRDSEYADNSLMMLLKVLMRSGVKEVNLAGFDGYSGTDDNYLDVGKEYEFAKKKADYLNNYMSGFIRSHKNDIKVNFLTSTRYDVT